jgi:hypothetical protein
MEDSQKFSYVPYVGHGNIIRARDNDRNGVERKFIIASASSGPQSVWVQKDVAGDDGNINSGGSVDSYTSQDPQGHVLGGDGDMLTTLDFIGDELSQAEENGPYIMLTAIPSGLQGLLGAEYSLANQPPAGSFDYSQWLPRVAAEGKLSFYGGLVDGSSGDSGPFSATGRFPTVPVQEPATDINGCGPLLYLPPGFYDDVNTIFNDLLQPLDPINITLLDRPQTGILATVVLGDQLEFSNFQWSVDFSWSGSN